MYTVEGIEQLINISKGISKSSIPYKRTQAAWLKASANEVESHIIRLAKKGCSPSQIGVLLRDCDGIGQVKAVSGSKVLRVLKRYGMSPNIPEDLYCLIKKAVAVRKHMEKNHKDLDSKFRLILIESRIHRLSRYYKRIKQVSPTFKYESSTASTLIG